MDRGSRCWIRQDGHGPSSMLEPRQLGLRCFSLNLYIAGEVQHAGSPREACHAGRATTCDKDDAFPQVISVEGRSAGSAW